MYINFATCERGKALGYLQHVYPSCVITDTDDCAKPLLALVEKDICRVQDPNMHGSQIAITPSTNFVETMREDIVAACKVLTSSVEQQKAAAKVPA